MGNVKHTAKHADERLVPKQVPWHQRQMILDHTERYTFASHHLKQGLILDAACGSGYGTLMLSRRASPVIGVDISDDAIRYAKLNYGSPSVTYKRADVQMLPFQSDSFSSVVSFETLEHVPDYAAFLREVYRVLKRKGVFIVSTPNVLVNGGTANVFHIKELTRDEFLTALRRTFRKVELYGQKPMHEGYLRWVVWLTSKFQPGLFRWFLDSLLKMVFRGTKVVPIDRFGHGFVPAFFVAVCEK